MKVLIRKDINEARAKAYPSTGDQLDAIWKIIAAIEVGNALPRDALKVMEKVKKVKIDIQKRG